MQTTRISKPPWRRIPGLSLSFLAVAFAQRCIADSITYDISYDQASGVTTLSNLGTSAGDLQFETLLGALQGEILFLEPANTVTIDPAGNIAGSFIVDPGPVQCTNKTFKGGTLTVTQGFVGEITVYVIKNGAVTGSVTYTFDGSGTVRLSSGGTITFSGTLPLKLGSDEQGKVTLKSGVGPAPLVSYSGDAQISPITPDANFSIEGLNLASGQANVELTSGGLESVDDTLSFTSILTPNVMTGCPEPSDLLILGLVVGGLLSTSKRSKHCD